MSTLRGLTRAQCLLCVVFGFAVVVNGASFSSSVKAQDVSDAELVRCNFVVSLDKRLIMEQWAMPGECSGPTRTRVTDQFLGFSCLQLSSEIISCRPLIPRVDSRAFDTAKSFRCVDVDVIDGDGGIDVNKLREWAAQPKQCAWNPDTGVLAMEVDFEHDQVCLSAFCIDINRLSAIDMTRLRHLIASALKELNPNAGPPPIASGIYSDYMGLP
jgi:hypothetical protein